MFTRFFQFANLDAKIKNESAGKKPVLIKTNKNCKEEVWDMEAKYVLVVTKNGYAKRVPIEELRIRKRPAKGVSGIDLTEGDELLTALPVGESGEIVVATKQGRIVRMKLEEIKTASRSAKGSRLLVLEEGDSLASVSL